MNRARAWGWIFRIYSLAVLTIMTFHVLAIQDIAVRVVVAVPTLGLVILTWRLSTLLLRSPR